MKIDKFEFPELPKTKPELEEILASTNKYLQVLESLVLPYRAQENSLTSPVLPPLSNPMPIELKGDQPAALTSILDWLGEEDSSTNQVYGLFGVAGAGKSTLIRVLYRELRLKYSMHLTASTNKAAKNLFNILRPDWVDDPPTVSTVHSFFGISPIEVEDEIIFDITASTVSSNIVDPSNTLILIDEIGTLQSELLDKVLSALPSKVRILVIGDPYQNSPVGERRARVFNSCKRTGYFSMLRTVLRFDDIKLQMATDIREAIANKDYSFVPDFTEYASKEPDTIFTVSRPKWHLIIENLIRDKGPNLFLNTKILAYRNKVVDGYNEKVRDMLGFEGDFCKGDIVMFKSPFLNGRQVLASIDTECTVEKVTETTHAPYLPFSKTWDPIKCYELELSGEYEGIVRVPMGDALSKALSSLSQQAKAQKVSKVRNLLWADFWKMKSAFVELRFGYALTIHRSQGSTYDSVHLDMSDIGSIPKIEDPNSGLRSLYVAVTRPRKEIYVF